MPPVKIGWHLNAEKALAIYFPPERVSAECDVFKSVIAHCPAFQDFFKNTFVVRAPFDIELERDADGRLMHVQRKAALQMVNFDAVNEFIKISPPHHGRGRDLFQLTVPYSFVSDTPGVEVQMLPPFMHMTKWPGLLMPGRFNIFDWPFRQLNFSFEWHDPSGQLIIKRGDPLYYVQFFAPANTNFALVEVDTEHPKVRRALNSTREVTYLVHKGTRKLMRAFGLLRPTRLIFERGK
jgi:hypothetical protein